MRPTARGANHAAPARLVGADETIRNRLLSALVTCLQERGYQSTTVADIVAVARTSRRAFYQEFADKEQCFAELLTTANTAMIDTIVAAVDPAAPWQNQVRQAVEAWVVAMRLVPEVTLSWIRELPALGSTARPVQRLTMQTGISMLTALTDTPRMRAEGVAPMSRALAVLLWGGLRELTATVVEEGRPLESIIEPATAACIALLRPDNRGD